MNSTTNVIALPTAAPQRVVNPTRMGRRARGGKVTLACDFATRRWRKERDRKAEQAAALIEAEFKRGFAAERLESALCAAIREHPAVGAAVMDAARRDTRLAPLVATMLATG